MLGRLLFAVSLLGAGTFAAQQPAPPAAPKPDLQPAPIRVEVEEVIVPVTVTDPKGRFVTNLEEKDFKIFDEGREQRIRYFSKEGRQPVVIGFLIDQSNANRLHWKTFQEAAIDLVLALMPGDDKRFSGYLISYGNEAEIQANTHHDPEEIVQKIRKLKPGGGAALYDAIYMACTKRDLVKGEPIEPRRVIIIIGDGHDNASRRTLDEVIELAQRNLVTTHGVSTVAFGFNSEGEKNLVRLVEETGGRVEYPLQGVYKDVSGYLSTPSDEGNYALKVGTGGYASAISTNIFRSIAAVIGEVNTQYILRYVPDATDSARTFRNIRVEISLAGVNVRHRRGYFPYRP